MLKTPYRIPGPKATSFCDPRKWVHEPAGAYVTLAGGSYRRTWHGYKARVWQLADGHWQGDLDHGFYPIMYKVYGPYMTALAVRLAIVRDIQNEVRWWRHGRQLVA